ncbi:hypothetical protein Lfu02_10910 [Longispora fulva]|uniref:Uncharacterized protein n=1 Tax=Longispora fulva TaxID=619741 RepID=A0A8J7GQG2_9ACTN|nr:hypothetical protein [Longispora fulva]MBG6135046.1 hypothetical protein [Longispora fulva]GIG56719.1 hypothetical protein Lfu02_10910 [Longispora fulva]
MADGRRSTASLCVLPDNRVYIARLVILAPFLLVGMVLFFFRLLAGGRDGEGAGGGGALVATVLGLGLPLLYVGGLIVLRLVNARILLDGDRMTVRNAWRWPVFVVPVDDVTGMHSVDVKVGTDQLRPGRIVVTSRSARPFVVDARLWRAEEFHRLVRRLRLPLAERRGVWWERLREEFPGVRMPWSQVHPGVVLAAGTIGTLVYIFVMVNLAFRI